MGALGLLTAGGAGERARAERLQVLPRPAAAFLAPHFVERVRAAVRGRRRAASRRRSTRSCSGACAASWTCTASGSREHGAHNVAVAVLDNARGEWLAWEGSGDYFDRRPRRRHRRRRVAAPARLGAEAVHLRARLRARLHARLRAARPARALPDRARRACSTARATTTACSAARCARGRPWPARRTCPRSGCSRRWACPTCCGCCAARGLTTLDKTADHYGYALTMGDAEVRLRRAGGRVRGAGARRPLPRATAGAARGRGGGRVRGASRRRRRDARIVSERARLLGGRRAGRRARARVRLRPRRQPGLPVPGRGEDRHVAGVPRQLDGRASRAT